MKVVCLVLSTNLEVLNFFEKVFPRKYCTSRVLPSIPALSISTASTSNNENVESRCNKWPRIESYFGHDFVTIFLTENGDANYLDDMNKNFVQVFILEEDPRTYEEAVRSIDYKF